MNMSIYPEPVVGAFILNKNDEVLLIQQAKWSNQYCIPGGHIELNESIESALKREVREEVGLDIEVIRLFGVQESICSKQFHQAKHFIFLDYLCRSISENVQIDHREAQDFIWVSPQKALDWNLSAGTRTNIEKYLYQTRLKSGGMKK
jgi:nucleoside triphosphatase